jgi:L-histidine N-alpha-methyltransferase
MSLAHDMTAAAGTFAADVMAGLTATPKILPARCLWDAVGSALFEAITWLPEYGLTAADQRILETHAAELAALCPAARVAELGSGTGRKTRPVLEAFAARRGVRYHPIDLSTAALQRCGLELSQVAGAQVAPVQCDYLDGLAKVTAARRRGEPLLVLFLGSTIGNFPRPEVVPFLAAVRAGLQAGDALLLGTDLEQRVERLVPAYDDPAGVTAAFDRNVLARMNRELGADCDVARFAHEARWNARERRVEMHLRADSPQVVHIAALRLTVRFAAGETLWTESSYKFDAAEVRAMGAAAGFTVRAQWLDRAWPFAETLLEV